MLPKVTVWCALVVGPSNGHVLKKKKKKKKKLLASKPRHIPVPRVGDAVQSYWWLCVCSPEGVECWKEHGREDRQDFRGILSTAEFVGLFVGSPALWTMVVDGHGIARSRQGDLVKACKGGCLEGKRG